MTTESPDPPKTGRPRVLPAVLKYLACYILGIGACIVFTPVEGELIGKALWPLYPILAPIGFFLYYLYLDPGYTFGSTLTHWLVGSIGLGPVVSGAAACLTRDRGPRALRPLWIAFPIGFVGTLGVYHSAAASI